MNKLKFIILATITIISCSCNSLECVEINQKSTELPIVFRLAKDNNNRIITMQLPVEIDIKNNCLKEMTFLRMYYNYNKTIPDLRKGGFGMSLYERKNGILHRIPNKKTSVDGKKTLDYICYTSHFIDSIQSLKLNSYIKEMSVLNKDTLSISISEFQIRNSELFNKLTKNDSISVRFLDSSTKSGLGERIAIPVKW
ncbi:MAG: hypothetical protein ACERIH_10440 [Labilibaculum antarcticum]